MHNLLVTHASDVKLAVVGEINRVNVAMSLPKQHVGIIKKIIFHYVPTGGSNLYCALYKRIHEDFATLTAATLGDFMKLPLLVALAGFVTRTSVGADWISEHIALPEPGIAVINDTSLLWASSIARTTDMGVSVYYECKKVTTDEWLQIAKDN